MKKIITLILALSMCLTSIAAISAVSAYAADKVEILDTNVKANIQKAGCTAETKNVNSTKYSIKWDLAKDLYIKDISQDFTRGNTLHFSMMLDSPEKATLMVYFGSDNPGSDGIDYYRSVLKDIKPGEWIDYTIDLTKLAKNREPLGWDKIGDFSFRSLGWGNKAAEGSVAYIENIYLTGDKMPAGGAVQPEETGDAYAEKEANKGKVFYWADFDNKDVSMSTGAVAAAKTNTIEHAFDSGDNGFVNILPAGVKDDCYFEATLKDVKVNKWVVEMDVKTENGFPGGNLQYKDSPDRKTGTLINFGGFDFIIGKDNYIAKAEKGEWTHLGFIFDVSTNKAQVYVNGEKKADYSVGQTTNNIVLMRMYIGGGEGRLGKDIKIDNFAVYEGDKFKTKDEILSAYEPPKPQAKAISAKAGTDVEMVLPDISKIGNGVALKINNSNAYAKGAMAKVDKDNEAVVPVIVDSRTLVPVRFISESFDADVAWDGNARKVTVTLGDKVIELAIDSNVMKVNGTEQMIDVPAAIIENRTMLPLRALVEALGKNVLWDTRGLIIITDKETVLDAEADVKLSTMLIGKLEKNVEAKNYAAYPSFTQSIIDDAVAATCGSWSARSGNSNSGDKSAAAIYYLTLAARSNPDAAASDGTLCKDAALKQIRHLIAGGNEPFACVGCYWGHAVVAAGLLLVKNTPVIYDELTADEKDRIDWLMRCLAIAGNWGYNDLNNYSTGFDLMGNFGKGWNPNYKNTYLSVVISSAMYFGAEELDKIYTEFDYDTYIAKLTELGFTNILNTWTVAGKDLMENGGECTLLGGIGLSYMEAGQSGGNGAGVKIPFKYNGMGLDNLYGIYKTLLDATYKWEVLSEFGTPGTDDHCKTLTGAKSPFEGQMGMMAEFAASDGGSSDGKASNIRSRCGYGYDSWEIQVVVLANMKLFGGWDSSTEEMRKYDNRVYVGHEDLLFKMGQGYYGYSSGKGSNEYEYNYLARGHKYIKDIWKNFHCMLNEQVTTAKDPNYIELPKIEAATPKEGDGTVPEGAMANVMLNNNSKFELDSYHMIGKELKAGTLEFDIVLGNDITIEDYDCVIMPAKKMDNQTWSNANMLIQFTAGTIKIRNGGEYKNTNIQFEKNYRYHVKVIFDAAARKYTVELNQTYPKAGEVYKAENYDFRKGGAEIDFVDSISIVNTPKNSTMWIENLVVTD